MSDIHEKIVNGKYNCKIYQDDTPINPRNDYDNLGTLYIQRQPRGGDISSDKGASYEDMNDAAICLDVYIFDHSGISISTCSFCDSWDSWHAGYYYVTKETMRKEYGDSWEDKVDTARNVMESEIEMYDQYLRGEVYGYIIENNDTGDQEESCWGFFGDDGIQCIKDDFDEFLKNSEKEEHPLFDYAGI